MTLPEYTAKVLQICADVAALPSNEQEAGLRQRIAELPQGCTEAATSLVTIALAAAKAREHIVILVHGIRTHASWAEMVSSVLREKAGVTVVPLRYGFFDVFRFLCPWFTRKAAVRRIVRELRDLRADHPTAQISAIAHSFGTYALVKALDELDIRLHRVVFCGCIVTEKFRRAQYGAQLAEDPLNDCGTHDPWPVLAKSLTWGYGATGTFGFGTVGVRDRFNKFGHCDYFNRQFVERYWVPFIRSGQVEGTDWERKRKQPPYCYSLLSVLPLRWIILGLAVWALGWAILRIYR